MRRVITLVVACAAVLATAGSARAAAEPPVAALKAVLSPGHGVRVTETATVTADGRSTRRDRQGVLELAADGSVRALDVTTTGGEHGPERAIGFEHPVGGTGYRSGGLLGTWLKDGKTWWLDSHQLHLWHTDLLGHDEQVVNPAEPATLATLLDHGRRTGDTVTGEITFKDLGTASSTWHAHSGTWATAATRLSYTLTLAPSGLVGRLRTTYAAPAFDLDEPEVRTYSADTRYDEWGAPVTISPPDPAATTTELCINGVLCKWRLPS